MIETKKINEIVRKIARGFDPEQIILFGSHAEGIPNKDSDLDLLIIQETDLPLHRRSLDIRMSLIGTKVPMDIIVYTKREFEAERKKKYSFINTAIKTSKTLYERPT